MFSNIIFVSDANLPQLSIDELKSSISVCKPCSININNQIQLPEIIETKSVKQFHASDSHIMRVLFRRAFEDEDVHWLFVTRDWGFLQDASIMQADLERFSNIHVIVLKDYLSSMHKLGYFIDSNDISNGNPLFLQRVMYLAYKIWQKQHYLH